MPITDTFQWLPLSAITVLRDERQRREVKTEDLERSIASIGVLQPIICRVETAEGRTVFNEYAEMLHHLDLINASIVPGILNGKSSFRIVLVAGERRLEACRRLGLPDIPVRFAHELSPTESSIIELEENIKRSDLAWPDLVNAISRIHSLYTELDPEWTQAETARAISVSGTTVSIYLTIAGQLSDPRVAAASTTNEAYNIINRREQRALGNALEELLGPTVPVGVGAEVAIPDSAVDGNVVQLPLPTVSVAETILHTSFLDWIESYTGPKFNLIHCDFPYGINPFSGSQGRGSEPSQHYTDSTEIYFTLLQALCKSLPRLMSVSAHLMFWYSDKLRDQTLSMFRNLAPNLDFQPYPLIWVKSDNAGIAADFRHGPRHIYETCLLASRGSRQIVRVVADVYSGATDHRLHPSTKPEGMLRHFFSMLVDEQSLVLDPTCGSGSAIRAAEACGAQYVLGIEENWGYCEAARLALRQSRTLRQGERIVR